MYISGVVAGRMTDSYSLEYSNATVFFLENEWKPETGVSRFEITKVPLIILVVINGVFNKYQLLNEYDGFFSVAVEGIAYSLKEWRDVRIPHLKQWMDRNQEKFFEERMQFLKRTLKTKDTDRCRLYTYKYSNYRILNEYHDAYLQDYYQMAINYEEGQTISLCEKEEAETESAWDLFLPLRFCKAANDRNRQYICCEDSSLRKGITLDHPFVKWLLNNAILLNQYYQRQFRQIIDCLCNDSGESIMQECNYIRQLLTNLPIRHGVDVSSFPQLGMEDFWVMDKSKAN